MSDKPSPDIGLEGAHLEQTVVVTWTCLAAFQTSTSRSHRSQRRRSCQTLNLKWFLPPIDPLSSHHALSLHIRLTFAGNSDTRHRIAVACFPPRKPVKPPPWL